MNTGAAKRRQKEEADSLEAFASESASPELRAFPSESEALAAPLESPADEPGRQPRFPSRDVWLRLVRVASAAAVGVGLGLLYPTFLPGPEPAVAPVPPSTSASPSATTTNIPPASPAPETRPLDTPRPPSVAVPPAAPPVATGRNAAPAGRTIAPSAPTTSVDVTREPAPIVPPAESASPLVLGVTPPTLAPPVVVPPVLTPLPVEAVEARAVAAPPPAPATIPDAGDRPRIRAVLDAYTAAYERLDAVSAASLWPGVDTRALTRAFSTLSRQSVSFDRCEITIDGARATAQCDGAIEYVRRIGDSTPHSRSTSWVFAFDRTAGAWRISNVTAR